MKEEEIIKGCIKNDRRAQFALYSRWRSYLYSIALGIVRNDMDAEDVLQESFLKIFKHIGSFSPGKSFKAWLAIIVKNTAFTYLLSNKKHRGCEFIEDYEPMQKTAEEFINSFFARDIFHHAMERLHKKSPNLYMYARLRLIYDMDAQEISEDIDVPIGTAKSQISRGCSSLRTIITDFEDVKSHQAIA